jgi:hypothetical protein
MRKGVCLFAICAIGIVTASCYRSIPASRPPYTVTGVVEAIDAETLALRHKSGQRIRIALGPGTAVSRREQAAAVTDIAVGMRIVVLYRVVQGTLVADQVHLFRPPIKPAT